MVIPIRPDRRRTLKRRPARLATFVACALPVIAVGAMTGSGGNDRAASRRQGPGESIVIDGATLIDVVAGTTVPDARVVIEGERITAAGPRAVVAAPPGATVIAATGKYVLPGLTDAHVHLRDYMPELLLAHGLTSVIDLGNPTEWTIALREGVEAGRIRGPRVFTSGGVINGPPKAKGHHLTVETPEEARALTAELAARKVDVIKVHAQMTAPLIKAVADEAHKHNLSVVGHLGIDAREAVLAGLDNITHAYGIGMALTSDPVRKAALATTPGGVGLEGFAGADPGAMDDFIKLLRERNVIVDPNLMTTVRTAAPRAEAYPREWRTLLLDPRLWYVPADNPLRWEQRFLGESGDPARLDRLRQGFAGLKVFLKKFREAGGTMLAGTDIQTFAPPGISLHQELDLYVHELGLTPLEAIRGATVNIGKFLRRTDIGVLRAGNLADVIVVGANPLADIRHLRQVSTVIVNGRVQDTAYHTEYRIPIARPSEETSGGNPIPIVSAVAPVVATEATAGETASVRLVVTGADFVSSSIIRFDGVPLATTFKTRARLEGELPASLLRRVGTYRVTVWSPRPDGGESAPSYFIVKFRRPAKRAAGSGGV